MTKSFSTKTLILGVVITFAALLPIMSRASAQDTDAPAEVDETSVDQRVKNLRDRAEQTAQRQADKEERTAERLEQRQAACEARKQKITDKMEALHGRGVAFGQKVDSFVTRIDNFVSENNLEVQDYDQMLADVQAAQQDLAESLAVARELRVEISCSDVDGVKEAVDAYKSALAEVKADAKDVVSQVKEMARAVKAVAAEQADDDTEDSDADDQDDEGEDS